ncbi:hypothetical protein C8R44DRAFT_621024, partial [Mycena epipterygia]
WLSQVTHLARSSRGIKAGPMRRLYLATCVPRMLDGADIFLNAPTHRARRSHKRGIFAKLGSIQCRAALAITGALLSTPGDVLNAYANLLPIKHLVDKVCHGTALCLATLPDTHLLRALAVIFSLMSLDTARWSLA